MATFLLCCQKSSLDELSVSCVIPLRKDYWKLALGFSQTLPHVLFAFVDCAQYTSAIISYHHEYEYMVSLLSLPRKLLNWRVVLVTPAQ